jgi:predicted RNase H-like HicB family nuclease
MKMKFWTTLDRDEDGVWVAECHSTPGCVSQGVTREEALAHLREALILCLEVRDQHGMTPSIELDVSELSASELTLIEHRLAAHHVNRGSSLSVDEVIARLEARFPK